jgi:gliding motility-associated-like protein
VSGNTILYTPNPGFVGLDTLYYNVCDNGTPPLCDAAMVVIDVTSALNNPPVAVDDNASTPMNTILFVPVLANDSDPDGNNLVGLGIVTGPSRGYAAVGGDSIIYVPNTGFAGLDTLTYVICDDGVPSYCDTARVIIDVYPINNPPVAENDSITVQGGTTGVIPVLFNDYDPDSTFLDVTLCAQPDHGSAVINANGTISYTPATDYTGPDTLCYIICDQGTPVMCDTALVFITVEPNVGIFVPNTFTPNGDGDNDFFVVVGLENYPNATVEVFNRWGNIVYSGDPYRNEWNGNSNAGQPLPVGTYYYILDLKDGNPGLSGFVVLHR